MQTDRQAHLIRRVLVSSGAVTTLAGQRGVFGSADGPGVSATFSIPSGIAMDAAGTFALIVSRIVI